jgi:hypothetical protein
VDKGLAQVENLYDPVNLESCSTRAAEPARAHALPGATSTTSCSDGEVVIIDEFTGRALAGRRWGDGRTRPSRPRRASRSSRRTRPSRRSPSRTTSALRKLSGMTGTADTEATEFHKIYGLDVVVIPTNKPIARDDANDLVYLTEAGEVPTPSSRTSTDCTSAASPCWSAPTSVEKSERSPGCSRRRGVPHNVLNAKPRAGGLHRRPGRAPRGGHHRHQHGRSGHGHRARRQPRDAGALRRDGRGARRGERGAAGGPRGPRGPDRGRAAQVQGPLRGGEAGGPRRRRPGDHRHRAPRVAPHRQPAPRPLRSPGRSRPLALLPVPRGRPDAHLRRRPGSVDDGDPRHGGGRPHRAPLGDPSPSRTRRRRSRSATSTSARTSRSTTTS